ncbi:hypothetical protein AAFF_G00376360 [Aldrovandia affinis]|uniref:Leptin n=1 Tax=Aldrovandia affinis TaxID=143900 RepID=A0AAD7SFS9_9TELE|nr:hypothetical protein AAFF_G00376360 [Aldrovandia affinis]
MLCAAILLSVCTLASALPLGKSAGNYTLRDTYSDSLKLSRKIHHGVRDLLPQYDAVRLQQVSSVLQEFGLHIDDYCSSEPQLETEAQGELSRALELLQLDIRDLNVQITQQLKSLHHPATAGGLLSVPSRPLCSPRSLWVRPLQGYMVLRGLESCLHRVVRDYTLLRSQQQQ